MTRDRNTDHNRNQPPSRGAHRLRVLRAAWRRAEKHPADTELGYDVDDWTTLPCPAGIVSFVPSELDPAKDEFIVCDTDKLVNLSEWV